MRAPPAHEITTANLAGAYPLLTESGLGHRGVLVGLDLLGASFVHDPFTLYSAGVVSNPNMVVLGQIGRGKSALVKSYLWRQAVFGRRAWVVDPKGEYGALANLWGTTPLHLRPGGAVRLNPLDPGPFSETTHVGAAIDPRRSELLASLASSSLGHPLGPRQRVALDLALRKVLQKTRVATLPGVIDALFDPDQRAAIEIHSKKATLIEDGRDIALEFRRLVVGDLAGMFDGETSPNIDLDNPFVVLDLSSLYQSPALALLMLCATAWLQAALARQVEEGKVSHTFIVVDEAWAVLRDVGVARWLQASWKLSRAYGVSNMAVLHRLSDLRAVGESGSEQVQLANGLLADSETRVIYAQGSDEIATASALLSLSESETDLIPRLGKGVALWQVGRRSFLVRHLLSPHEFALINTDQAMR